MWLEVYQQFHRYPDWNTDIFSQYQLSFLCHALRNNTYMGCFLGRRKVTVPRRKGKLKDDRPSGSCTRRYPVVNRVHRHTDEYRNTSYCICSEITTLLLTSARF